MNKKWIIPLINAILIIIAVIVVFFLCIWLMKYQIIQARLRREAYWKAAEINPDAGQSRQVTSIPYDIIDAATVVRLQDYTEAFLKVTVASTQNKVRDAFKTLTINDVRSHDAAYVKVIGELASQGIYVSTVGTSNTEESK